MTAALSEGHCARRGCVDFLLFSFFVLSGECSLGAHGLLRFRTMTSFLALRASVCAYLWCLIPPVCYIGFEQRPPSSHSQRSLAGYLSASGRSPVRNLLDPYTRCLLRIRTHVFRPGGRCVGRSRHGSLFVTIKGAREGRGSAP